MFCCLNVKKKNPKYISEQIKVTVSILLVFNTENHSRKYPYGNSRIRNNNPYKDIVIYHFFCFRMRSRRVQARPNEEEGQRPNPTPRSSRQDPGCFEYGGKCDVCCVDYYGCCSLLGCCGFHGSCACCCSCCRCCREPEEGPGISSLPVSIFRKWKQKAKGARMNVTRPVLVIQYNKAKKKSVSKASKSAKVPVLPLWLPHKNPVRDINTSTR